jgi:hypothetical protein
MSIEYDIQHLLYRPAPLYYKYPDQAGPQKCYLEMNSDGLVTASWDWETDDTAPEEVQTNERLRWPLSPYADGRSLYHFLRSDRMQSLLNRVHDGHRLDPDGSHVWRLSEDAQQASFQIESVLNDRLYKEREVHHVKDWLESRFSAEDVVSAGSIDFYIVDIHDEAMRFQEDEYAAFFGKWGQELERLCLDYVDRAMEDGDEPDETARKLAQMLADYDRENYGDLPEKYDRRFGNVLPFNRDGNFDGVVPVSRTSEQTDAEDPRGDMDEF